MNNHTNDSLSLVIKKKKININSNFWHGLIKVTALESYLNLNLLNSDPFLG